MNEGVNEGINVGQGILRQVLKEKPREVQQRKRLGRLPGRGGLCVEPEKMGLCLVEMALFGRDGGGLQGEDTMGA